VKRNNQISNDPFNRISDSLQNIISKEDVFFDVHCHVFNYRDVPDTFLGIRVPQNLRLLSYLEKVLHKIKNSTDTDKLSKLAYFINFLKTRTTTEIAEKLFAYSSQKNFIICPLMMDMTPGIGGRIIDDFQIQIEKMRALKNAFPEKILPFLALDPNNPKMADNFYKVFEEGGDYNFFGVKIYPSLGYLPSHPKLMEIFSICEKKKIPVTAHCSGATVHTNKKIIRNIPGLHQNSDGSLSELPITMKFRKRNQYSDFFNHPTNWNPVLDKHPGLKLNLAHFGGDEAWNKYSTGDRENWVTQIIRMMHQYENLFADFSYTLYNRSYAIALKDLLNENYVVADRVLYGSDYYMVVTEGHFNKLNNEFISLMGDPLMKKIAKDNPLRFLFG